MSRNELLIASALVDQAATMATIGGMSQVSEADRFYMASRLRKLRTELTAVIKALEVPTPPLIKAVEGK